MNSNIEFRLKKKSTVQNISRSGRTCVPTWRALWKAKAPRMQSATELASVTDDMTMIVSYKNYKLWRCDYSATTGMTG